MNKTKLLAFAAATIIFQSYAAKANSCIDLSGDFQNCKQIKIEEKKPLDLLKSVKITYSSQTQTYQGTYSFNPSGDYPAPEDGQFLVKVSADPIFSTINDSYGHTGMLIEKSSCSPESLIWIGMTQFAINPESDYKEVLTWSLIQSNTLHWERRWSSNTCGEILEIFECKRVNH